jgi:beta-glucosidase
MGSSSTFLLRHTPSLPPFSLSFGLDSTHGAGYVLGATLLPHQLSIAATFSRQLATEFGAIAGRDTLAAGVPWLFSPILGLGVNPLWPRLYETFGEGEQPPLKPRTGHYGQVCSWYTGRVYT